jgi:uncharacterized membrane protein
VLSDLALSMHSSIYTFGGFMSNTTFSHYIIVDDVESATGVLNVLKQLNVCDEDIGVISKDSDIAIAELPQADLSEKSKLPEALKRGALLGSGSGLLAGVVLTAFPTYGITVGGAAILGMAAGGGAIGAWAASLIGISENSELVQQFEDAIDNKKTLILCKLTQTQANSVFSAISPDNLIKPSDIGEIKDISTQV